MYHLPSLELFIRNFLTCLEVERRFSLKNGFLAKFNKKGDLSSLNKKISFRFVSNVFVVLICVSLRTLMWREQLTLNPTLYLSKHKCLTASKSKWKKNIEYQYLSILSFAFLYKTNPVWNSSTRLSVYVCIKFFFSSNFAAIYANVRVLCKAFQFSLAFFLFIFPCI